MQLLLNWLLICNMRLWALNPKVQFYFSVHGVVTKGPDLPLIPLYGWRKHFLGRLKVALLLSVVCGGSKGELVPAEGCCFLEVYICFVSNNQAGLLHRSLG